MLKTLKEYKNRTYVGYSTNIIARLEKHNASKGAKSTRGYKWKIIFTFKIKDHPTVPSSIG